MVLFENSAFAQVGINNTDPDPSSSLDITSTTSGVLVPRMTEIQKNNITAPIKGLLIFQNNAQEGFWYFNGTIWVPIDTKGEFVSDNGVIYNVTNRDQDDFVVGSKSLDNVSGGNDDNRLFFDKDKAAFRAGSNSTTSWDNTSLGSYSVAIGYRNTASGTHAVALGRESIASGEYAVSLGRSNNVSSTSGTSFGYINEVSGDYGTAIGRGNVSSGTHSFVGGINSDATALNSFAFGDKADASGDYSLAFGRLNTSSGLHSTTIGFTNTASSQGAFALGNENDASGDFSMAIGNNLLAPSYSEVAVGIYNTSYTPASTTDTQGTDRIFSVGNGFRSGGVTTQNNALTILKNGQVGIGTDAPKEALEIHGDDNFSGDADLDMHSYGNNITSFHIRSAAGTQNNPTAVSNKLNANYYNMEAQGYDGSSFKNASAIRMGAMANNLTGAGDMPGRIDFHTSTDGTADIKLRMRIDDNGNVGIGTTAATSIDEKLVVEGKIKATSINFSGLTVHTSEANANADTALASGDLYRIGTDIKIKL